MTKSPPTLTNVLEELNVCKAKLNAQKIEIEQLTTAVKFWRTEAAPKPVAVYNRAWRAPLRPEQRSNHEMVKATCRRNLLGQWAEQLKVPGMYTIRLVEQVIPANDTGDPWDTYQITMHVWEKPDHGTTNTNT